MRGNGLTILSMALLLAPLATASSKMNEQDRAFRLAPNGQPMDPMGDSKEFKLEIKNPVQDKVAPKPAADTGPQVGSKDYDPLRMGGGPAAETDADSAVNAAALLKDPNADLEGEIVPSIQPPVSQTEDLTGMGHLTLTLGSVSVIFVSEIGDKTFFVAALMAMKHPRLFVFSASYAALALMTVLSAVMGRILPSLLSPRFTTALAAVIFLLFSIKLLLEAKNTNPEELATDEMQEAQIEIQEVEFQDVEKGPQKPSQSYLNGLYNLGQFVVSPLWMQIFGMNFLGEWGDRSQVATIVMSAGYHFWPSLVGGLIGHALCTSVAVICGGFLSTRLSMRTITLTGAVCFFVFAGFYARDAYTGFNEAKL